MRESVNSTKERIHWIDVAKGLLIILVVYGHLDYFSEYFAGTSAYNWKGATNFMFLPWYMPAFFIITGLCSNFETPVFAFVKKNFKSLMIPSFLIGSFICFWLDSFLSEGMSVWNIFAIDYQHEVLVGGGGAWFLSTLFLSKVVYRLLITKIHSWILIIISCLLLMQIGIFLLIHQVGENIWCYQHALVALPFIALGSFLKTKTNWLDHYLILLIGGATLLYCYVFPYPYFNASPLVDVRNSWLMLLLSVGGSFLIFFMSKRIKQNKYLETIGKHTLVIYLIHRPMMVFFVKLSSSVGVDEFGLLLRILFGLIIVMITIICSTLIDELFDSKIPVLKGKFSFNTSYK